MFLLLFFCGPCGSRIFLVHISGRLGGCRPLSSPIIFSVTALNQNLHCLSTDRTIKKRIFLHFRVIIRVKTCFLRKTFWFTLVNLYFHNFVTFEKKVQDQNGPYYISTSQTKMRNICLSVILEFCCLQCVYSLHQFV